MRILIVEDEIELLHDIAKGLTLKGYAVDQADNGRTGYQMAVDEEYDLIVLDLNLPGMDGFSILRELLQEKPQTKVLILEARIRVLLNRKFIQQSSCLTYDGLSLDTLSRTAGFNGVPIGLTAKECSILEYFLLNQGRLITQQELIEHVWNGDADPFSNSIRVHLSALRKKLKGVMGSDPIHTKIGEGYLLC